MNIEKQKEFRDEFLKILSEYDKHNDKEEALDELMDMVSDIYNLGIEVNIGLSASDRFHICMLIAQKQNEVENDKNYPDNDPDLKTRKEMMEELNLLHSKVETIPISNVLVDGTLLNKKE